MNPRVVAVKANKHYTLDLTFSNGEERLFDMKPYLTKGIFKELRDVAMFNTAHISFDTVEWDNEADFDPEVLYTQSKKTYSSQRKTSIAAEPRAKYKKK